MITYTFLGLTLSSPHLCEVRIVILTSQMRKQVERIRKLPLVTHLTGDEIRSQPDLFDSRTVALQQKRLSGTSLKLKCDLNCPALAQDEVALV